MKFATDSLKNAMEAAETDEQKAEFVKKFADLGIDAKTKEIMDNLSKINGNTNNKS